MGSDSSSADTSGTSSDITSSDDPKVIALDIDGTITTDGIDLFMLSNRHLHQNKEVFDEIISAWRIKKPLGPVHATLDMMEQVLKSLPHHLTGIDFTSTVKRKTLDLISQNKIRSSAIQKIKQAIHHGYTVFFCTTNYLDSATGFANGLTEAGLLSDTERKKIIVTGSKIDWDDKKVLFLNIDTGKVESIANHYNISPDKVRDILYEAYGDEPTGNDKSLLNFAKKGFIISTKANREYKAGNLSRLIW